MAQHKQVVVPFDDRETEVDAGIAPLLLELWRVLGPCTLNSCEDDEGKIWIHFRDGGSVERLVNLVALVAAVDAQPPHGRSLSYRARGRGQAHEGPLLVQTLDAWSFDAWPIDFPTPFKEPVVWLTVHLRMPQADGVAVLDILSSVRHGRTGAMTSERVFRACDALECERERIHLRRRIARLSGDGPAAQSAAGVGAGMEATHE